MFFMTNVMFIEVFFMTNEKFIEKLSSINSSVLPQENYKGSKTKINFKCNKCNNIFSATPNSVLNGSGCPICSRDRIYDVTRKKEEKFINELKLINPNITILGHYINNKTHIETKCNICGCIWNGTPVHLLHGSGCPECARVKKLENLKLRHIKK